MANAAEVWESLVNFAQLFNDNTPLKQMLKGWDRVALISPSDLPDRYTLDVRGGACTLQQGAPTACHLEIVGTADLLSAMFWGEITPTEPYLDGRLLCRGAEEDLVKLDFVTAMIWE